MSNLKTIPGLIKQEHESLSLYANLLFQLIHVTTEKHRSAVASKMFSLCRTVVSDFILKQQQVKERNEPTGFSPFQLRIRKITDAENDRNIQAMVPIISQSILTNLKSLDLAEVKDEMGTVLSELIISENEDIRRLLQDLLKDMLVSKQLT